MNYEIYFMFCKKGKTIIEIAKHFNKSKQYISKILKTLYLAEYEAEKESRKKNTKVRQKSSEALDNDGTIYRLYFKEGKTTVEICNIQNKSFQYISKVLKTLYFAEYEAEKERRKKSIEERQKTSETLDRDGVIYRMYFKEGKTTVDISNIQNKSEQYISKILLNAYAEEYFMEKERRKAINRKRHNFLDDDECHYKYRDRPLMPQETISTISFIKMNRQSYITDENGNLIFDKNRGGVSSNLPRKYTPIIW